MFQLVYEKGKWLIDTKYGWVLRAANNKKDDLYGACPTIKVRIGDVEVDQNLFLQNHASYCIILGQPYIIVVHIETKVLDYESHYARIRSKDGRKTIILNY